MSVDPRLDTSVPHSARVWNYWCGGKDNFAADRATGEQIREAYPEIVEIARASRAFLARATTFLAGEAGVRQFLDIGTGLPTADNTHEVAQRIAPDSRIAYVDNDPLVLVHARALLTSDPAGATEYIDADVRDPDAILREAARIIDFGEPVGLMMLGILGNVADTDEARAILDRLLAAVPSGSYLVINDGTKSTAEHERIEETVHEAGHDYVMRRPEEVVDFFDGLELVAPGVVPTPLWRPLAGDRPDPLEVYCGVARKP